MAILYRLVDMSRLSVGPSNQIFFLATFPLPLGKQIWIIKRDLMKRPKSALKKPMLGICMDYWTLFPSYLFHWVAILFVPTLVYFVGCVIFRVNRLVLKQVLRWELGIATSRPFYGRLANRSTNHPTDRSKAHREVTLPILIYCWQLSILMIIFRNCKYKIPLEAKRLTDKTYRWTKQSAKGLFLSSIYIYG